MAEEKKSGLELSTAHLNGVRTVTIDEQSFDVPAMTAFPLLAARVIQRHLNRAQELLDLAEPTEADETALVTALDSATVRILAGAPRDLIDRLTTAQKLQLCGFFTRATEETSNPSPTKTSSLSEGSSDSTEPPTP